MAQARLISIALALALAAAACGASPEPAPSTLTGPSSTTQEEVRVWKGAFDITSCSDSTVSCRPAPEDFALRLGRDGAGVLQIRMDHVPATPVALDVTARTSGNTTVVAGSTSVGMNVDVELVLTRVAESLEGTLRYTARVSTGHRVKEGRVLFATRDPSVRFSRLHGAWLGYVARIDCTGDCAEHDPVLPGAEAQLELSPQGSAITGRFNWDTISGSASGDGFNLSGQRGSITEPCRASAYFDVVCFTEVTIEGRADAFDRLQGTISYRTAWYRENGPRRLEVSVRADLRGVVRWP
jgi:hypothetical protein